MYQALMFYIQYCSRHKNCSLNCWWVLINLSFHALSLLKFAYPFIQQVFTEYVMCQILWEMLGIRRWPAHTHLPFSLMLYSKTVFRIKWDNIWQPFKPPNTVQIFKIQAHSSYSRLKCEDFASTVFRVIKILDWILESFNSFFITKIPKELGYMSLEYYWIK